MKWRGALARTGLLASAWLAAVGCGDGDVLSADRDAGLPLEQDGSVPDPDGSVDDMDGSADADVDIDGNVGVMDAQLDGTTSDGSSGDGNVPDGNVVVVIPDGGVLPVGGVCESGYQLVDGFCFDVDECASGSPCALSAVCTNLRQTATTPGYVCACANGYTGDGVTACTNVDECSNNTDDCPINGTCADTDGSFTCGCMQPGYVVTGGPGSRTCVNRDECADGTATCDPRVVCSDTDGSFTCSACPAGYDGDSTNPNVGCTDIDECDPLNPLHNCMGGSSCINNSGGFTCGACPVGTTVMGNICVDVDECTTGEAQCGMNAVCTNTTAPVKYTCTCPLGYAGDPNDLLTGCVVTPVETPTLASGYRHTCAVYQDGTIDCWGANNANVQTPPMGMTFQAVTNGLDFSCAMRVDGTVSCWGDSWAGQAPTNRPGTYLQIAAGERNVCGLLNDNTISCWGRDDTGQSSPPPGEFRAIAAGASHMCALSSTSRDTITCWGAGGSGRTAAPTALGAAYTQVSLGAEHSCALDTNGDVRCWGGNSAGQATVPATLGTIVQVSAGGYFTCALDVNHTVTCWGSHGSPGVTGDPIDDVPPGTDFAAISASNTHVCGVTYPAGNYVCWGENQYMQASPPP